jgi:hypothetical protein
MDLVDWNATQKKRFCGFNSAHRIDSLLSHIFEEAAPMNLPVTIHVERFNPAPHPIFSGGEILLCRTIKIQLCTINSPKWGKTR